MMIIQNKTKKLVLGFVCVATISMCFSPRIQAGKPWFDTFKEQVQKKLQKLRPYAPHVVGAVVVGYTLWKIYQYRQRKNQEISCKNSHVASFTVVASEVYDENGTKIGEIDKIDNEGSDNDEKQTQEDKEFEGFDAEQKIGDMINSLTNGSESSDSTGDKKEDSCNQQ